MGGQSTTRPYYRFAAISFLIVALVSLAGAVSGVKLVGDGETTSATRTANGLVGAPLRVIVDDGLSGGVLDDEARLKIEGAVRPLLAGDGNLQGVRVWASGGTLLYASDPGDASATPVTLRPGRLNSSRTNVEGESMLVTRAGADGYTIEITQAAGPLDTAIAGAQRALIMAVIAFALATWAVLQGAFWFGIRILQHQHGRLSYMYDTGQQLRASLDLEDVMTRLAGDATQLARGRYGFVALYDSESSDLALKVTYDNATGNISTHHKSLDEWFLRRCVATNTTVVNQHGGNSYKPYFGPDSDLDAKSAMLCVPLSMRDRIVGAVGVLGSATGREAGFADEQIRLVEQLASQAVTAVEQAQLFARVRADATEIEASYDSTLKALMAALDAKDEVTEGHCERVAKLTLQLARDMEVPPSMLVHIERGALLHDVGKIGVPDAILKKPKALNDSEWEAMRKHPLLAGLMVSKVGFLEPALPILLYHHERYDGGGYPFGLSGENIPVEARIFMVIDAYDAMTSDRPYRAAMRHADAMKEIRAHSGSQFDPDVVASFEHLMASRPDLREQAGTRVITNHDDEHAA